MSAFFGELYLRSTRPMLSPERTDQEVEYLSLALRGVRGPILDVGCGHGRHAAPLRARGHPVIGLELDALSIAEREPGFPLVRADFSRPPFHGSFGGAYAWYSTLFTGTDAQNGEALAAVRGCLRPGARCLLHSVPRAWFSDNPRAVFHGRLPDGAWLDEENTFDVPTSRDVGTRRLRTVDGRTLEGTYAIRYYTLVELEGLARETGFVLKWAHGDLSGGPVQRLSSDLVVGLEAVG